MLEEPVLSRLFVENGVAQRWRWLFIAVAALPSCMTSAAYMLTETTCMFCLSIGFYYFIRSVDTGHRAAMWASALAFASAAFVRPTYQLLFLAIALTSAIFARKGQDGASRRARFTVAIVGGVTLISIGAYSFHNYTAFGYFGITPMLGFNLTTKTTSFIDALPENEHGVRSILIKSRDSDLVKPGSSHSGVMYIWQTLPELEKATGLDRGSLSRYMLMLNAKLIAREPLEYLAAVATSFGVYWFPAFTDLACWNSSILQAIWSLIHFIAIVVFWAVVLTICVIQAVLKYLPSMLTDASKRLLATMRPHFGRLWFALSIISYTMFISTFVEVGNPRYRLPTDYLILFVTISGLQLLSLMKKDSEREVEAIH